MMGEGDGLTWSSFLPGLGRSAVEEDIARCGMRCGTIVGVF